MSNCPECDVINYGINPRCVACVRKIMGDRIKELEAQLTALRELVTRIYDSQCVTNNKQIDVEQWADDAAALLQEDGE